MTRIVAAIYGETPTTVNQQVGGVGSLEENMNSALIQCKQFINIDNVVLSKGKIFNSVPICTLLTEPTYSARAPYLGAIFIDPTKHIIQLTTNGCNVSIDIMNRSNPVSIRKKYGHTYKGYPSGSILDEIKVNQSHYLGAVFSVLKAWHKAGKPKTSTTTHESSFTPWAQTLGWIVENLFGLPPLLDGYERIRSRITSPDLLVIRDLAFAVRDEEALGRSLIATDLIEIAVAHQVELPSVPGNKNYNELTDDEQAKVRMQIGSIFSRVFKTHSQDGKVLFVDGFKITRKEEHKEYDKRSGIARFYTFDLDDTVKG